jgi:hypothetical protein
VADAYSGSEIKQAISDFFAAASGIEFGTFSGGGLGESKEQKVAATSLVDSLVYVGHDRLMDFQLEKLLRGERRSGRRLFYLVRASSILGRR